MNSLEKPDYLEKDYRNFYDYEEELIPYRSESEIKSRRYSAIGCLIFVLLFWAIIIYLILK